jgi:ribosomal-protein-alanine N-acetyltransferase
MGITGEPWKLQAPEGKNVQLLQVPPVLLDALAEEDLDTARSLSAISLTPYLVSRECSSVWRRRRDQLANSPGDAAWVTRIVVDMESGGAVGRAGFHGAPDETGMVEVGYETDPAHRRQGYARAALLILLAAAKNDPTVTRVRATVRPDNLPSRQLLDQHGFQEVGEQLDEEDGLETILEVDASSASLAASGRASGPARGPDLQRACG